MTLKIDKRVPIPKGHNAGGQTAALKALKVGDSFFAPGATSNSFTMRSYMRPKKFTIRTLEENGVKGVRVWRVE
jgi:hypothetical protein